MNDLSQIATDAADFPQIRREGKIYIDKDNYLVNPIFKGRKALYTAMAYGSTENWPLENSYGRCLAFLQASCGIKFCMDDISGGRTCRYRRKNLLKRYDEHRASRFGQSDFRPIRIPASSQTPRH